MWETISILAALAIVGFIGWQVFRPRKSGGSSGSGGGSNSEHK